MKRLGAVALFALLPALAFAQDDAGTPRIDNSMMLEGELPTPQEAEPNAVDISNEIFGDKIDDAYGAYQRGF